MLALTKEQSSAALGVPSCHALAKQTSQRLSSDPVACLGVSDVLVALSVRLTTRWCLLLLLAAVRCVYTLTEQPLSSLMSYFEYVQFIADLLTTVIPAGWTQTSLPGAWLACII